MKKRSHKLLASTLLESEHGFSARRYELAFLFGSFQPDCNPLTYLKGSLRADTLRGHNYANSRRYVKARILRLQHRDRWTVWQYYTLGKLTHYLADAFTYPHNGDYPDGLLDHRTYEDRLREYLADYLSRRTVDLEELSEADLIAALEDLHRRYLEDPATLRRDAAYILEATSLLMAGCLPRTAA